MNRVYPPNEVHAIFEREGWSYPDILDAMDAVAEAGLTVESPDEHLFTSVEVAAVRAEMLRASKEE